MLRWNSFRSPRGSTCCQQEMWAVQDQPREVEELRLLYDIMMTSCVVYNVMCVYGCVFVYGCGCVYGCVYGCVFGYVGVCVWGGGAGACNMCGWDMNIMSLHTV